MKKNLYFFAILILIFTLSSCKKKSNEKNDISSDFGNNITDKDDSSLDGENKALEYRVNTSSTLDTYVIEMVKQFGDSIYIKSGDFDMLIDAGQYEDGVNVNSMLKAYCTDSKLDVLIATHGHADHLGGFEGGALDSIENIGLIIDFGYIDNGCRGYQNERKKYLNLGADYFSAYDCVNGLNNSSSTFIFSDDLKLDVINTNQYAKTNKALTNAQYQAENDFSVVVKLTFKNNTYLFTGDLAGALDDKFTKALMNQDLKDITVYKAAHHGASSNNSNNSKLLNYLNPKICVSSSAIVDQYKPCDFLDAYGEMSYQHPRPAFVRWILNTPNIKKSNQYYYNGTMGTIHLNDNGIDVPSVEGLGATKGYYNSNGIKVTGEENMVFSETQMYKDYYLQ